MHSYCNCGCDTAIWEAQGPSEFRMGPQSIIHVGAAQLMASDGRCNRPFRQRVGDSLYSAWYTHGQPREEDDAQACRGYYHDDYRCHAAVWDYGKLGTL